MSQRIKSDGPEERGYARSLEDFENIPLSVSETGSQIRIKDVGQVVMGPTSGAALPIWMVRAKSSAALSSCATARTRSTSSTV